MRREPVAARKVSSGKHKRGFNMHAIIYLVGLVVIVLAIVNLVA